MVMEASPSPQSVGREFVRQYYTLMNKAPAHLHRFYNQNSYFVHGGLESFRDSTPAVGQKEIHEKIQQLNFRDCHAKITQVDCQLTLENGVVVQVSGELSNAGQPMRRFTQTFILAKQDPKTYYVHNDIFRYQDMIFPDEEETDVTGVEGSMGESVERDTDESRRTTDHDDDDHQNQGKHLLAAVTANDPQNQPSLIPAQQQPLQQQQQIYYAPQPQQHVHQVMQQVLNGSVHEESPLINQQPPQQPQQPTPSPPPQQAQHQYIVESANQFVQESELNAPNDQQQQAESIPQVQMDETHEQSESESFPASVQESETEQQVSNTSVTSNEPKTYANKVKASYAAGTGSTSPQATKLSMSPPPMTNLRVDERSPLHPSNTNPALSVSSSSSQSHQQTHRVSSSQNQQQNHQQNRQPRSGPIPRDGDRRGTRPGQYSDANQLFLGNLPHNVTESDLRELFERFGKVADLRIHSKPNDRCKGPQGGNNTRVPNYGFITFEDEQVAQKVLDSHKNTPIRYPDESGQKLNVEEKKVRPRLSMDGSGGRLNSNDSNMRPMGQQQQQQQRGPGGPGGVMRGGQHGARGGRGGFSRSGDGGRGGGGMRQSGNPSNPGYQNRR